MTGRRTSATAKRLTQSKLLRAPGLKIQRISNLRAELKRAVRARPSHSETSLSADWMALFKRAVGVSADKYYKNVQEQAASLPDSGFEPTNAERCEKLRDYLWAKDLERIHGSKMYPLYPMQWKDGECTGAPMQLIRVGQKMKKKDGREQPNPNYGRFFVADKVLRVDEDGMPVLNDKGFPVTDLDNFKWFDETDFVRQGAFKAVAPQLEQLMLQTNGEPALNDQVPYWPANFNELLA